MDELLLPLFPLEIVLLPEEPLPLHIFEDRYKEMIGECLRGREQKSGRHEFGIALAEGNEMRTTGCTARIVNVTRKYPDGRMDIFTVGARRFEILYTDEKRSFLRAGVEYFEDDEGADTPGVPEAERAIRLFRTVMQRLHQTSDIPIHLPNPYRHLSFRIAAALPLDTGFKHQLLVRRNEIERLRETVLAIKTMLPRLERVQKLRSKAGGNGHAA